MNHFTRLLQTFHYHSFSELAQSLAPSGRYGFRAHSLLLTISWTFVDKLFGLDQSGFLALLAIFPTELISGIWASSVRGEKFSSVRLSRFGLKVACYMIIIGVSYSLYMSFKNHNEAIAAFAFNWLHITLVTYVGFENVISILENIDTINGKEKGALVIKLKEKLNNLLSIK